MHTDRTVTFANIDYSRVMAEANAERAKMLRQMFLDARAYIVSKFTSHGAAAAQH